MHRMRHRVGIAQRSRAFEVMALAGLVVSTVGCHGGVHTPVAPSGTADVHASAASGASLVSSDDVSAVRGAPLSFTMEEVDGSGYSGTCTVGSGGSGFRIKAVGRGMPNTLIRFILHDTTSGYRYTDFVEVDHRGAFRTGQDRVTFFESGLSVECLLMERGDGTILARGLGFEIP